MNGNMSNKGTGSKQLLALLAFLTFLIVGVGTWLLDGSGETTVQADLQKNTDELISSAPKMSADTKALPVETKNPEEDVYSYLQGPKSWAARKTWSGAWAEEYMDGGYFGGFGCGLCCMANIYSTLTEYQCTPLDMYQYTKKNTYYGGGMAVEWGYMRQTLSSLGFDCQVRRKPSEYEKFARQVEKAQACIVLVSSNDSQVYWQDTPGHYVTIFLYDAETEKVFLADSGDPEHNRSWISLRKIYKSLKTASSWQFLQVTDFSSSKDLWKHKKASGEWVKPAYAGSKIGGR